MKPVSILWVGLATVVLIVTLYFFDNRPNSDIEVFLIWSMLLLSFPSGLLIIFLFAGISYFLYHFFSVVIVTSYAELLLSWFTFSIVGYLQWFKLIPHLVAKWREKKKIH